MPVTFSKQNKKFLLPAAHRLSEWLEVIAFSESRQIEQLEYLFCDDPYLLSVNQEFLHHDTYTDILTFDYSAGNRISGDILISTDRVRENARMYRVSFRQELLRVMAHGLLHCCGYKDKRKADQALMRNKEDECLLLWEDMN